MRCTIKQIDCFLDIACLLKPSKCKEIFTYTVLCSTVAADNKYNKYVNTSLEKVKEANSELKYWLYRGLACVSNDTLKQKMIKNALEEMQEKEAINFFLAFARKRESGAFLINSITSHWIDYVNRFPAGFKYKMGRIVKAAAQGLTTPDEITQLTDLIAAHEEDISGSIEAIETAKNNVEWAKRYAGDIIDWIKEQNGFEYRCVICMLDFQCGDRIRFLPCMHTYHAECIDDWLMRSFTCPSCMEPVDAALQSSRATRRT